MNENKTMDLVDSIYDLIDASPKSFGSGDIRKIDAGKLLGILDEIRETFPMEFAESRKTMRRSDDIVALAESKADKIIEDAREQARIAASDHEIVRMARAKADKIVSEANMSAITSKARADDYIEHLYSKASTEFLKLHEALVVSHDKFVHGDNALTAGNALIDSDNKKIANEFDASK